MLSNNAKPYDIKLGEKYMNDKQLKHFQNILEHLKKELMSEENSTQSEIKKLKELADPSDQAIQEETMDLEFTVRDRQQKLIKKIEAALQHIDNKSYGYCESCGLEIGIKRLEARPTADMCIDCKKLGEQRKAQ